MHRSRYAHSPKYDHNGDFKKIKVDTSKTQGGDRLSIFQREIFGTSFPAEVKIMATNFIPESTPINQNIVIML
jgi:hypothetical protein